MESEYLQKVLNGDIKSFSYFIKTYQNVAYGVAMSIVKSDDKAKDVVQESFILAYNGLSSFKEQSKFSTWLYRIVVNKSLRILEKEKRYASEPMDDLSEVGHETAYNDALSNLRNEELKLLVKKVLDKVPPKEALVLQLFYLNDHTIDEVRSITNFSKTNVKVLLHRGRKHFYNILKKHYKVTNYNDLIL